MSQPEINVSPRLKIRFHKKDNTLDEVITYDENGECDFHMEQMDDFHWWMQWHSTAARPLPREVVVNLGPSGGIVNFEAPNTIKDEKYTPEEYKTKPGTMKQRVDEFIRYFGMGALLEEMIAQTKRARDDEKANWPNRDVSYLVLVMKLKFARRIRHEPLLIWDEIAVVL